jgi:hypothetical protein
MLHDDGEAHQNKATGPRQSNLYVVFSGSRSKLYRKQPTATGLSARTINRLRAKVAVARGLHIGSAPPQETAIAIMATKTKAPARTVRQDATQILNADQKKVSKIFAEFEKVKDNDSERDA